MRQNRTQRTHEYTTHQSESKRSDATFDLGLQFIQHGKGQRLRSRVFVYSSSWCVYPINVRSFVQEVKFLVKPSTQLSKATKCDQSPIWHVCCPSRESIAKACTHETKSRNGFSLAYPHKQSPKASSTTRARDMAESPLYGAQRDQSLPDQQCLAPNGHVGIIGVCRLSDFFRRPQSYRPR
jgi:hypothetical protein